MPIDQARAVVNTAHTPARAAGVVFDLVKPRMAGMWHCHVIDGLIEPVFAEVAKTYSGAATLCQDLTVFNVTPGAVSARQAEVDWVAASVVGPSVTERTLAKPHPTPAWWQEAAIDWQAR